MKYKLNNDNKKDLRNPQGKKKKKAGETLRYSMMRVIMKVTYMNNRKTQETPVSKESHWRA